MFVLKVCVFERERERERERKVIKKKILVTKETKWESSVGAGVAYFKNEKSMRVSECVCVRVSVCVCVFMCV